jgi:hypothetical protein
VGDAGKKGVKQNSSRVAAQQMQQSGLACHFNCPTRPPSPNFPFSI